MSTPITPHDFSEIRWRGHWIWVPEEPIRPEGFFSAAVNPLALQVHGLFRKTIHLDRLPGRIPARFTADSRYALFINGREVCRGPIRSQPRRMYYDLLDLAPYLRTGKNVLAVCVKYYGTPQSYWMPAVPNNTLGKTGLFVFEANLSENDWVVSDASWKAKKAKAWSNNGRAGLDHGEGVPVEVFDAPLIPPHWQSMEFNDSAWEKAQLVPAMHIGGHARTQPPTDPYGPLYPRPIAYLTGELKSPVRGQLEILRGEIDMAANGPIALAQSVVNLSTSTRTQADQFPIEMDISAGDMGRLNIDMGRIVSGSVRFAVNAPAGTVFDFSYTEEPLKASPSMDQMRSGTRYIARGTEDDFQVFDSNGFRYVSILIHHGHGPIALKHFGVQEALYPWRTGATFECSDDELNRIFQAGLRTVQLCSQDAFIDCPTREQRAWVGDSVVHQMVHLATNLDWRLAWHNLTLANSPRSDGMLPMSVVGEIEAGGGFTIPDWALHWIHGIHNCCRFGGDREAVRALLPTAERILAWYIPYQTSRGILKDVIEWNLVDWSSVSTEDTSAALTALWARGLKEFAELSAWLGDLGRQRWADQLSERVKAGFDIFWDEKRGSYLDHLVDGKPKPEMTQITGALAIVSGLAPRKNWDRIIATITDPQKLVVRSWMGDGAGGQSMEKWQKQVREGVYPIDWDVEDQIVLAEPFMSYVVHDAVAMAGFARKLPDLYRRWLQFLQDGYDTIGECWDFGTHVHGWSCTPTRDMVFYTLGVTPAEPGYTKARIAPRLGRLAWAKGHVPTPHGLISIEVNAESVTIDSPVPFILDLEGRPQREFQPGKNKISIQPMGDR